MTIIYVLRLEEGKYYVGKTSNMERRFQDHLSGNGSTWTRKYRPIEIIKVVEDASMFEEDKLTKEYMAEYGIDNVRGGSYVTLELSTDQKEFLKREIWGAQDLCVRCGKAGHFIRQCPITISNTKDEKTDVLTPIESLQVTPTLTIPNPVFLIKSWLDTNIPKIHNEITNPHSDLRSGRFLKSHFTPYSPPQQNLNSSDKDKTRKL